jgi:hypothetical protein
MHALIDQISASSRCLLVHRCLRCSHARMSSMARSNHRIVTRGHDVNGGIRIEGWLCLDRRNASQPRFALLLPQSPACLKSLPGLKSGARGLRPVQRTPALTSGPSGPNLERFGSRHWRRRRRLRLSTRRRKPASGDGPPALPRWQLHVTQTQETGKLLGAMQRYLPTWTIRPMASSRRFTSSTFSSAKRGASSIG